MNETKFTPGPWEVSVGNNGSIFGDLNNPAHDGDNPYIGTVAGIGSDNDDPECTANAKLTDLLSAIELALNIKDLWSADQFGTIPGDIEGTKKALKEMQEKLEAAYKKALT